MSRLFLNPEERLHQDMISTMTATSAQNLFCICCLDTNLPLISLITCNHSEYLDIFSKPELKPDAQVVCLCCHMILKKIKLFKQQVQNSFKMLCDKVSNIENLYKKRNLEIHQAVNIDILDNYGAQSTLKEHQPQIKKTETLKCSNKKMDNIQTALEIIKNNNSMSVLAATALSTNTLLNFRNTLLSTDILKSFNEISNYEVPVKKIKLESEHENQTESNQVHQDINQIQSESNENQSESNVVKQGSNEFQSNPHEIQPESILIKLEQNHLHPDSNIIQPDSNKLQPDSNKLQPDSNKLQSDSNELQPDSNELQSDSNELQSDPNEIQQQSNKIFNRKVAVPKSHRDKIKVVRITEKELQQERALLLQANNYLKCDYKCITCIVGFQYQDNYNNHLKRKHTQDSGSIVCEVCSQRVATDCDYELHLSRHYKRYQCIKCDKRYQICDEAINHYLTVHVQKKFKNKKVKGKFYKCHCKH